MSLLGTWHLERFVIEHDDGRPDVHPFGEGAFGQLVYAEDGHMSAVLCRADRAPFAAGRLETATRADAATKAAAFDSYLSYGGRWTVDGDVVTHHVTHALFPDLVGQAQSRRFVLTDDALALSYTLTPPSGVTRTYRLRWVRPRSQP